ncbi:MAG: sigma-70 family RNA polymerase sigma factor [Saprospiraceae bacterium]|nr:sigma-70 family RNA polymerase sigma factor [Saprospiraceae bacterium]
MKNNPVTPAELAAALAASDPERRRAALKTLFEDVALRKRAFAQVRNYGGNRQDGEDMFQEAIIVLDRKLRRFDFVVEISLEAYFIGIVRWCWFNETQRRRKAAVMPAESSPEPPAGGNPEIDFLLTEQREQLEKLLEKLQEKCCKILKMYQLEYSMDEIAQAMGFANSGVAKKEAFLCRQRFKALLNTAPELWKDIYKQNKT